MPVKASISKTIDFIHASNNFYNVAKYVEIYIYIYKVEYLTGVNDIK